MFSYTQQLPLLWQSPRPASSLIFRGMGSGVLVGGEGWRNASPRGLVNVPVLDVCTGWGPVIHSANCSDSESISLSATMVKIQEGSGDAEKASRERKREKRKTEKLASKAGAIHAGNAEITPPELLGMHSAGRASGKDSYDRSWNLCRAEKLPSRAPCLGRRGVINFCPWRELCIQLVQTLI